MTNAIVVFLELPLKVSVTPTTLDEVFLALCIQVDRDVLLLKLALAMRTGKLSLFAELKMFSDFVTAVFQFAIHALNLSERTLILHVFHYHFFFELCHASNFTMGAL